MHYCKKLSHPSSTLDWVMKIVKPQNNSSPAKDMLKVKKLSELLKIFLEKNFKLSH
jgi:hypothetical protein